MTPQDLFNNHLVCRWTIGILFTLLAIPQRPSSMFKALPGISKKIFYERISSMIKDGLLEKRVIRVFPSHVEYNLTKEGGKMLPLLRELRELKIDEETLSHVFKCKWLKSILITLSKGTLRTMGIKDAIGEISNKVLSEKLKKLERFQLIEKTLKLEVPLAVKYNLSYSGKVLTEYLIKYTNKSFIKTP